jgi:hypothetical protein
LRPFSALRGPHGERKRLRIDHGGTGGARRICDGARRYAILPLPETTDPVALGLMQGFPPPQDKLVTLANTTKFPNGRWAFHHLRELGPTANVWRGPQLSSVLPSEPHDLDDIKFADDKGQSITIAAWQKATYTDGLLVLHNGRIVYEKLNAGMTAEQPQ